MRAGYRNGARYVDVHYIDQRVRHAMIAHASDEVLTWTPPWTLRRLADRGEQQGAHVAIDGDPAQPSPAGSGPGWASIGSGIATMTGT